MEARKNKNLDLNKKRGLFFNIGLVISLLMVITAFEMRFEELYNPLDMNKPVTDIEILIPITEHDVPAQPVPPVQVERKKMLVTNVHQANPNDLFPKDVLPIIDPNFLDPVMVSHKDVFMPKDEIDTTIFCIVEKQPEPKGGYAKFYKKISKNLKYPVRALNYGVDGKVYIGFVVDKDGSLTQVEVLRGIGFGCDEEAVNAIASADKWNPGKQRGVPVRVKMVIPIEFKRN